MKKLMLLFLSFAIMLNGAFCTTKKSKVTKGASILLDWQGHDEGIEIPDWIKFVTESDKQKIIKEFDIEDYMVWVFNVRGDNLEFLESWTDKVELQSNVAQAVSMEVGRLVQAMSHTEENMRDGRISKAINDVTSVLSNVRLKGLERFASYWIKIGTDKNKSDVSYVYYAVWGVPKNSFKRQLDAAMKNLSENTAQDPLLMNIIGASIEKTILNDADASLEGTTYNDVK